MTHKPDPIPHGTASASDHAQVHGPMVGINLGSIIYNARPSDEQRKHLVRYLDRVARKLGRLRLRGLSSLDDKGLQLPKVYVSLATDLFIEAATGTKDQLKKYFTYDQDLVVRKRSFLVFL